MEEMPLQHGHKYATRGQLNMVWSDLDKKTDRIAALLVRTRDEMATKAALAALERKMEKGFGRVLGAIDAFARKAEAWDRKAYSHGHILMEHEALVRAYERRIRKLEARA